MYELASVPQEMGEIVVQGIRLGRMTFRRLFTVSSVLAFMGLIPTVILVWGKGDDVSFDISTPLVWLREFEWPYGISILIAGMFGLIPQAILLRRIAAAIRGQDEALPAELKQVLWLWPVMLLTALAYTLAVALGLILIAPGLIFILSLMFAQFAVVLDGQKPFPALNFSHHLVWGNWWRTLGLMLLIYVPFDLVVRIFAAILGLDAGANDSLHGRDLFKEAVLEMVLLAVLAPFFFSIQYLYYHDLKLRKQAN